MTAPVMTIGLFGMDAYTIQAETDLSTGLPRFDVIGLPDAAVRESRDRISAAVRNCGYEFPLGRITINLAPADVKKSGAGCDLAMLISLLIAASQLRPLERPCAFIGELSLTGEIRPVNGVLPMALHAAQAGLAALFVPSMNAPEASVVQGIPIYPVEHVKQLTAFLSGGAGLTPLEPLGGMPPAPFHPAPDFADVKGQQICRRALEIAAAGGHNLLLIGPPGSGKSMLAKRIPSILPDMTFEEMTETTKIHSVAGLLPKGEPLITIRPFRAPHHTISPAGLSGGGSIPRPGEISLAHNGVLFLDELPEFPRNVMEILRQPIEDGTVTISRVSGTLTYPCSIMAAAAMNPCPCGYYGHPTRACTCPEGRVQTYLNRVSGPLLDRLDLHVDALPVEFESISSAEPGECSAAIKKRVEAARLIQRERYDGTGIRCNAGLTPGRLREDCPVSDQGMQLLRNAFDRLGLSGRAYDRILKVSRTIADLDGQEVIGASHIAEAIQYRSLDRKYWRREGS